MNNMIFYKANNNRSLIFQTKLYIIKELKQKKVVKSALVSEAKKHVQDIYNHSKRLSTISSHFDLNYQFVDNQVVCDFVEGQALSEYLIKQLPMFNKENFLHLLDWFKGEVYTLLPTATFDEDKIYNEFFKPYAHDQSLEYSDFMNLDFNFDNIILVKNDYKVIDTEWVFDVILPKDYVVYRSVLYLFVKYRSNIENIISFDEIMDYLQISREQMKFYNQLEEDFQQHVYGKDRAYNHFATWCNKNITGEIEILPFQLWLDNQLEVTTMYESKLDEITIKLEDINKYASTLEIQILDKPAIIKLNKIILQTALLVYELDLTSVNHNASMFEDDYYTFLCDKAIFLVEVNENIKDLTIKFEIVDFLREDNEKDFVSSTLYSQIELDKQKRLNQIELLNIKVDQIQHELNLANGTIYNYHHPIKTLIKKIVATMRGKG